MEGFNVKFVGEVEKHPELYNHTLREYSRKDCTEKAWNKISNEVNLSVSECKDKWRNLRSTFAKNLKPKPSGSGATKKKPYYLTEAMQFTVPFIRVAGTPCGNLPEIPPQRPSPSTTREIFVSDDLHQETLLSENMFLGTQNPTTDQQSHPPPSFLSLPQSPRPPAPTPPQPGAPSASPRDSSSPSGRGQPTRKKKKTIPSDADKAFMEYFLAKTAKLTNTSSDLERKEGIQNYLNSLIPDLMKLNDVQLRTYKRKTLLLIDEVIGTSPKVLYRASSSVCTRAQPQQASPVTRTKFLSVRILDHHHRELDVCTQQIPLNTLSPQKRPQ